MPTSLSKAITNLARDFVGARHDGCLEDYLRDGFDCQVNFDDSICELTPRRFALDLEHDEFAPKYDAREVVTLVGTSGWSRSERASYWVGFDIDSSEGHKAGLSVEELSNVQAALLRVEEPKEESVDASYLDALRVQKSKSGRGLHVRVFFENAVPDIENEKQHRRLANAVLSFLAPTFESVGLDTKIVDTRGSIFWCYARDALNEESFKLLRRETRKLDASALRMHGAPDARNERALSEDEKLFMQIVNGSRDERVELNDEHAKLIEGLKELGHWPHLDIEANRLRTHTALIRRVYEALGDNVLGEFVTDSAGSDVESPNCYAFPERDGSWRVFRYHGEASETSPLWERSPNGHVYTFFNRVPSLRGAARIKRDALSLVYDPDKEIVHGTLASLLKLLAYLGSPIFERYEDDELSKAATLSESRNGYVLDAKRAKDDELMSGFAEAKKGWQRSYVERETTSDDIDASAVADAMSDRVRYVLNGEASSGWFYRTTHGWYLYPRPETQGALRSLGLSAKETSDVLDHNASNAWREVSQPFDDEHPGARLWNRKRARRIEYEHVPSDARYANWEKLLRHVGASLDDIVKLDEWCVRNAIRTGYAYLFAWCASLMQSPEKPLPYLFLWGSQNTGKSLFHEALRLLFVDGVGVREVSKALTNERFNEQLRGVVLAVVEEIDPRSSKNVRERLKSYVTAAHLELEAKGKSVVESKNYTHWVQTANDASFCPIDRRDTRVTFVNVRPPEEGRSKHEFLASLSEEASAFLAALMCYVVPSHADRLALPALDDPTKEESAAESDEGSVWAEYVETTYEAKRGWATYSDDAVAQARRDLAGVVEGLDSMAKNVVKKQLEKAMRSVFGTRILMGSMRANRRAYGNVRVWPFASSRSDDKECVGELVKTRSGESAKLIRLAKRGSTYVLRSE